MFKVVRCNREKGKQKSGQGDMECAGGGGGVG